MSFISFFDHWIVYWKTITLYQQNLFAKIIFNVEDLSGCSVPKFNERLSKTSPFRIYLIINYLKDLSY
jgi:hypothetical protein